METVPSRRDVRLQGDQGSNSSRTYTRAINKQKQQMLTNCIYLEDSETTVLGYRIYGSPWYCFLFFYFKRKKQFINIFFCRQPEFCEWGFNLFRGKDLDDTWAKIPSGVDILITHGPPLGRGDLTTSEERAGCFDLVLFFFLVYYFVSFHNTKGLSCDMSSNASSRPCMSLATSTRATACRLTA